MHRAQNRVWSTARSTGSSVQKSTPVSRLSGCELKTSRGNKQWVAKQVNRCLQLVPSSNRPTTPAKQKPKPLLTKKLSGHELRTKRGNRQWIAKRTFQLTSSDGRRQRPVFRKQEVIKPGGSRKGKSRKTGHFSQLVSMSGQKFVVDSGRRRMKRVSTSTFFSSPFPHPCRLRHKSASEQSLLKQKLAR